MKKGKTVSTKRGRNFNIVLTIVALVLIVAVGGFATYSWVEQATTLDVQMNGKIQRVPEGNNEYHHQVNLEKGKNFEISLNDYVDKASDMMFSPVSSADGINFFMQTEDKDKTTFTRSRSNSDRNVNYISFDFDVTSNDETNISFDDENIPSFTFGDKTNQLKSVRVAIQVNNENPMIFSQDGIEYSAIATDEEGNITTKKITPKKFGDYTFGKKSLFKIPQSTEENKINTKVRITIWIEGTDSNLSDEYASGSKLNMKLMFTTPWNKAATVKLVDKTANSMFNGAAGTFTVYDSDNGDSKIAVMDKSEGGWTANITGSQDNLKFIYVEDDTTYTWIASNRGDNFVYSIFDCSPQYGKWCNETEKIYIQDLLLDSPLTTGTGSDLDSHIKVSTDTTEEKTYYRTTYDSTNSKWYVNIDADYSELYVQYYSNGSELTAKWNATDGRPVDEETGERATTYYLLDTDGNTTDYSTGSWTDTYNIYFYDGTVDQITAKTGTTIAYEAFSGETKVSYGSVEKDSSATYRFVAEKQLKYTDKIDKVVFTLSRLATNGKDEIKYTWNGNGKVNKDIYYTANSYTKD